eukprot:4477776-Amphidinium_carterae.1
MTKTSRHQKMKQHLKLQNYMKSSTHLQRKRGRRFMTTRKHLTTIGYSRVMKYTLNKATKEEPHRFVLNSNRLNASGFETWRQPHATYDQGRLNNYNLSTES